MTEEKKVIKLKKVYADGSCMPNPGRGGWAIYDRTNGFLDGGFKYYATNNEMEFMAISAAVDYIGDQPGIIYSDSEYCIKCLTLWIHSWRKNNFKWGTVKNKEYIKEITDKLARNKNIKFEWVKGHAGIAGNEIVDKYAKQMIEDARRNR